MSLGCLGRNSKTESKIPSISWGHAGEMPEEGIWQTSDYVIITKQAFDKALR